MQLQGGTEMELSLADHALLVMHAQIKIQKLFAQSIHFHFQELLFAPIALQALPHLAEVHHHTIALATLLILASLQMHMCHQA